MEHETFSAVKEIASGAYAACKEVLAKEQNDSASLAHQCIEASIKSTEAALRIIEDPNRSDEEKAKAYELLKEERADRREHCADHRGHGQMVCGAVICTGFVVGGIVLTAVNPDLGQKCLKAASKISSEKLLKQAAA